ncbi:tetraspanin-14-like [Narcine bancroftii]|uniref:tetraspanin-14-like n=1 Tax=Narcine bancroftii TaxID=1343680 RepID=UPI003831CEDE
MAAISGLQVFVVSRRTELKRNFFYPIWICALWVPKFLMAKPLAARRVGPGDRVHVSRAVGGRILSSAPVSTRKPAGGLQLYHTVMQLIRTFSIELLKKVGIKVADGLALFILLRKCSHCCILLTKLLMCSGGWSFLALLKPSIILSKFLSKLKLRLWFACGWELQVLKVTQRQGAGPLSPSLSAGLPSPWFRPLHIGRGAARPRFLFRSASCPGTTSAAGSRVSAEASDSEHEQPEMHHKQQQPRVNVLFKYILFGLNIIFWLAGAGLLAITFWAWNEKGVLKIQSITELNGFDPVWVILTVGLLTFILGFTGCIGALRENICLLKFFSLIIGTIFTLELAAGILAFVFQDWVKEKVQNFVRDNIEVYRNDIDLQNLIDAVQKYMQCCGASGPDDWNNNRYFNCSLENTSRERCGVPFSCCVPDPAQSVVNTQCGYDIRSSNKGKLNKEQIIFTKGCIQAFENWLPRNIYFVAGTLLVIALLQMFSIYLARSLISEIKVIKMGWRY